MIRFLGCLASILTYKELVVFISGNEINLIKIYFWGENFKVISSLKIMSIEMSPIITAQHSATVQPSIKISSIYYINKNNSLLCQLFSINSLVVLTFSIRTLLYVCSFLCLFFFYISSLYYINYFIYQLYGYQINFVPISKYFFLD